MGGSSFFMMVCLTMLGPPVGVLVVVCGFDMGPLVITTLKTGSRFAPAMGLDGAMCRSGLDWYGSESESEAMWPFDGVRGLWERFRRCRFNVPNGGGSPLRIEEEHGGSIVLDVYQNNGNDIWTPVSVDSYWL